MDDLQKLVKRIRVIDRYTLSVGVYLLEEEQKGGFLFDLRDTICRNILSYYVERGNISEKQLFVLKDRLQKYAKHAVGKFRLIDIEERKNAKFVELHPELPKTIRIVSPYAIENIEVLKTLEGRAFDKITKEWTAKLNIRNLSTLESHKFVLKPDVIKWRESILSFPTPDKSKLNFSSIPSGLSPREYQEEGAAFIVSRNGKALIADQMGLGKAQPIDSVILTPRGYIKIKDLVVGDEIFGSDGEVYNISGIFPQGVKETYKVTFTDNTFTYCCKEHLWAVRTPFDKWSGTSYKIWSLEKLLKKNLKGKVGYNYFIPMTDSLKFKKKQTHIDPYLLGCLLGNGSLSQKENHNSLRRELNRLGLTGKEEHKFIPDEYKYNDIETRISILQGLLDTDRYAAHNTNQFTSVSKQLCNDVLFIIESLGGRGASTNNFIPEYMYNGEKRKEQQAYKLTFKLPSSIYPYRCKRKLNRVQSLKRKEPTRAIKSIEKNKDQECACIKTTAPNSLYLTNNCIVTHNTVQAIMYLIHNRKACPALIICPASLKLNWAKEAIKWIPGTSVYVLYSSPDKALKYRQIYADKYCYHKSQKETRKLIIINYDIIGNRTETYKDPLTKKEKKRAVPNTGWIDYLKKDKELKTAIIDEAHYLKNKDAIRTTSVLSLVRKYENIIALTGTPIENRPVEFYTILHLLMPDIFDSFWHFAERYCGATHNGFGWDFSGASNTKELHELLTKTVMIRRLKSEVLKDLPPKTHSNVYFEITNRSDYSSAEKDLKKWLISKGMEDAATKSEKAEALVKLSHLRRLAAEGKLDACIEWIQSFIDSKEKLIIFAVNTEIINRIEKHFGTYKKSKNGVCVKITGETDTRTKRQEIVEMFQNEPECLLFLGNIKAAGVGITLTAASNVGILQFPWVPGELEQAEDRAHRIGQLAESINIWNLIAVNTMEEDMELLIKQKKSVVDSIIDGKEPIKSASVVDGLIEKYSRE